MTQEKVCDVLILGSGMAGGLLARQLRLEHPDLKVVVIEKKKTFDWWVGESSVEAFDDYVQRVLKLDAYMIKNHIVKNGFRFFVDNKEKSLPIQQMSETGYDRYAPVLNGWQIDRAKFDKDIAEMNREMGVEVYLGESVVGEGPDVADSIHLDREKGHVVDTTIGKIRCTYLVDACGRSSPLAQKLNLIEKETLNTGAYWGRYTDITGIDALGDDSWHRRVHYTSRARSTNHFMYPGYWIWVIPLDERISSVGVVFERSIVDLKCKNAEDLSAFFRQHRAVSDILGPQAKCLDFMGLRSISRIAKQHLSEDRWFLTGMSGLVLDPFFSTTSAFYSIQNRMISEVIRADRSDPPKVRTRIRHFNAMLQNIAEEWHLRFPPMYRYFGCQSWFVPWAGHSFISAMTQLQPMSCQDLAPVIKMIDMHEDDCGCCLEMFRQNPFDGSLNRRAQIRLANEFGAFLDAHPKFYFQHNKGEFASSQLPDVCPDLWYGPPRPPEEDAMQSVTIGQSLYQQQFKRYTASMVEALGVPFCETTFEAIFNPDPGSGQPLADVVEAMRRKANARPSAAPPPPA